MRQSEYTRPLTDDTMLAVLQGNNQVAFPIRYGALKAQIIGESQKVGSVTFDSGTFAVTFASALSTANYQVAWTQLPSDVNIDSLTRTVNGFSGTYIGEGSGTGGFIAAVNNN